MGQGRKKKRSAVVLRVVAGLALVFAALALGQCGWALDPALDVSQYSHSAWKVREGFSKGSIYAIAQTPDGYLWLGTEFGLLRSDGVRNVSWQPPGNQHLPPGTIRQLLVARDGTLWIGAEGLASWKDGKLTLYPELAGQFTFALHEDREGTLWVGGLGMGGTSGKLCAIHSGSVHCDGDDGDLGRGVVSLYEDGKGNLWAGVLGGLWRWKPGPPKFYSLAGDLDGVQAIDEDADGALLVGWRGGIYRFLDGKTKAYSLRGTLRQFLAKRILHDRDGGLWVGTSDHGLLHLHRGRMDVFAQSDGLSGGDIRALFEDREGSIWVATRDGLDRFRDFAVATFTENQGLANALVVSVQADKDGSLWLATYGGLNRWDRGEVTIPRTGSTKRDGKLNGQKLGSLFQDDRGRIWVSTPREFGYLENGRFTSISRIPSGNVVSIDQDAAGNIWVAHEPLGLFRVSPRNEVRQVSWAELGHKDHASILAADRSHGGLWIGFFLGDVTYFADGQVRASYTAADGLGKGRVGSFQFDRDDTLWAATEGGLSRVRNGRVTTLSSKNGLPCDTVHWTIEGDDRSFWLYMPCGLVRIAHSDMDAWTVAVDKDKNTKYQIKATIFDSSDGVRNLSSPGHYNPQVAKSSDGKLWFLPWDGVSVIDPRHLPFNKVPPPVHIEQITADGRTYETASYEKGGSPLSAHVRDLAIDYTALSLAVPEKVHFRFKLEGQDKDWREVVNERRVQYSNLPPKQYRFRVTACNNSGVWNEEGASLDFSIAPAYYQTNWFRALCVVAFAVLLYGLYSLRLRQLAAQFDMRMEERVNERTRIARELHDTLLQSFQGLLMRFQAVSNELVEDETKQELDEAIDRAARAITEGRDAVQGLRSSVLETNDLAAALGSLGKELAAADNRRPEFTIQVEGTRRHLHPIVRDEVYSVAGEALRNAFRHADAQHIEVEIRYDEREFRLRVRDDGKGIDSQLLTDHGRPGHFGLRGMHERAKRVGGKLSVWSSDRRTGGALESGTEVELRIPAAHAYASYRPRRRWWLAEKFSGKDYEMKS